MFFVTLNNLAPNASFQLINTVTYKRYGYSQTFQSQTMDT